jgi:hypothetical protein
MEVAPALVLRVREMMADMVILMGSLIRLAVVVVEKVLSAGRHHTELPLAQAAMDQLSPQAVRALLMVAVVAVVATIGRVLLPEVPVVPAVGALDRMPTPEPAPQEPQIRAVAVVVAVMEELVALEDPA